MKASTSIIILAALRSDETLPRSVVDRISVILEGQPDPEKEKPLLVSANEAARLLGRGRTWFWAKRKIDEARASEDRLFPPVEVSPEEFSYRRKDIEDFANRTTTDAPVRRQKQKSKS